MYINSIKHNQWRKQTRNFKANDYIGLKETPKVYKKPPQHLPKEFPEIKKNKKIILKQIEEKGKKMTWILKNKKNITNKKDLQRRVRVWRNLYKKVRDDDPFLEEEFKMIISLMLQKKTNGGSYDRSRSFK